MAIICPNCGRQYDATLFEFDQAADCDCGISFSRDGRTAPKEAGASRARLVISVQSIKGTCPVYEVGDRIVLDEGYKVNLGETDNICMHSLASLMPYYVALYNGVDPTQLGLSKTSGGPAFVQCLDPCDITGGGTVVFKIERG